MSSVNPQASSRDGMFASHIGADSGSIWAAATSGETAIAVHLLACMLARLFTNPEAISVWVELVEKQREKIRDAQEHAMYSHSQDQGLLAARQHISRSDLAKWDASARAWLQSADTAKALQHKQMMLILNNASIPVNNEPDVYRSVIKAWTGALQAMNSLLDGLPQQVQDGAALLAISSWHIYPDMIVLSNSNVEVRQRDPFFETTATLTLGLEMVGKRKNSVSWSLPLARLQYYGRPVQASRSAGQDNSRITHEQFGYVVLGCIFKTWGKFAMTPEEGIFWLEELSKISKETTDGFLPKEDGRPTPGFWLDHLILTARRFLKLDDVDRQLANQLLHLGRRRTKFLFLPDHRPLPVFGLSHLPVLLPILRDNQCRVALLRKVFSTLGLKSSEFIIGYEPEFGQQEVMEVNPLPLEFATLEPAQIMTNSLGKRMQDGCIKCSVKQSHCRWMLVSLVDLADYYIAANENKSCQWVYKMVERLVPEDISPNAPRKSARLDLQGKSPTDFPREVNFGDGQFGAWISDALKNLLGTGEHCLPALQTTWRLQWNRKLIFGSGTDFLDATTRILRELEKEQKTTRLEISNGLDKLTFFIGHAQSAAIYRQPHQQTSSPAIDITVTPEILRETFLLQLVYGVDLGSHLADFTDCSKTGQLRPLKIYAALADLYQRMPGATISTPVTSRPLYEAQWVPEHSHISVLSLSLNQGFACIAMLDSGTCDLDPKALDEVFAMASGNSLYVASALIDDPYNGVSWTGIQRVIGNIGRPGLSLLIPPPQPKIRDPNEENWREINHRQFCGIPEDNFKQTSIHLSFTDYEMPLSDGVKDQHIIDRPIALVETLISVHDRGKWVADIDVVSALNSHNRPDANAARKVPSCDLSKSRDDSGSDHAMTTFANALTRCHSLQAIQIDNWEELLEPPEDGTMVVRSQNNWLARLALAAVCVKLRYRTLVLPNDVCWICCSTELQMHELAKTAAQKIDSLSQNISKSRADRFVFNANAHPEVDSDDDFQDDFLDRLTKTVDTALRRNRKVELDKKSHMRIVLIW